MLLRKSVVVTLLIQLFGVFSTAVSKIFVSRTYGPEGQGYYGYILSLILLLSSISLFGFPQSLLFLLNSKKISVRWTKNFVAYYTILLTLIIILVTILIYIVTNLKSVSLIIFFPHVISMSINEFMLVSFSSLFTVSVALLRIISLSQNEIFNYNLITSSNSIFLALLIFIFPFDEYKKISLLIFVSSIFSAFLASFLVKLSYIDIKNAIVNSFEKTFFGNIRSYFLYNLWSFLPAIAVPLSTNFTYKQLIHGGNDNSFAGYFDISILFLSFALLPLNLIVPILFNYWSKNKSNHNLLITSFNKLCLYGFLFSLIFLLFVVPLCPTIIPIIFGESFGPSIFPTQILLMSLYPNYMIRLYSAAFLSVGFPRTIAFGEISRTMLILCCMRIEQLQFPVGASIVWGLGSIICCFYMYFVFLRKVAV